MKSWVSEQTHDFMKIENCKVEFLHQDWNDVIEGTVHLGLYGNVTIETDKEEYYTHISNVIIRRSKNAIN